MKDISAHKTLLQGTLSAESVERRELSSGQTLLMRAHPESQSAVVQVSIGTGSVDDNDGLLGLAECMAEMLMHGTEKRDMRAFNEAIESLGASLGSSAGMHTTRVSATCLAEDLPQIVELIGEMLSCPSFPESELENVRGEMLTGLYERDNDTRAMASKAMGRLCFGDKHPYSRPTEGEFETVQAITVSDLASLHRQLLSTRRMVVTVVGAIDPDTIEGLVLESICQSSEPRQSPEDPPEAQVLKEGIREDITLKGKTQADFIIGVPGPRRRDPDYLVCRLANHVLGGFGLMGRLGRTVREEHGLAYYAASSFQGGIGPGMWAAYAGVDPTAVDRAIELCLSEMKRLANEPVPEEELDDSICNLTASLPLQLESNHGVAQTLTDMEWFGLGLDYVERYPDLIRAITTKDIARVAEEYLGDAAYAIAVAGPDGEVA